MIAPRITTIAITAAFLTGGCANMAFQSPDNWFKERDIAAPSAQRLSYCSGFACKFVTPIPFSRSRHRHLAAILARGRHSAKAERAALSKAVQWYETMTGPIAGTSQDQGGWDLSKSGTRGATDCLDEATNTTSLLIIAEARKLLKFHRTGRPVSRGMLIDGRYPHATAVVIDTTTETPWAIDSWVRDNGEPPDVMPLADWYARRQRQGPSGFDRTR